MSSEYGWTAEEKCQDTYFYTGGLHEMMNEYLYILSNNEEGYNDDINGEYEEDGYNELSDEEKRYYDELIDYYDSYYDDYNDY